MKHQKFQFNFHKTNFFGQYWSISNAKAVVVLVHGLGEYSSRYTGFFIPKLLKNKFSVVTFDHFGHGKTSGKRGHCPSLEAVLESVNIIVSKTKKLHPNKPVFLYGHSLGGNIVANYALRKEHNLNGVIASSSFFKLALQPPKWKLTLGRIIKRITPCITMSNEINPYDTSRDKVEVFNYLNDPLIHSKISPNFLFPFMTSGKWAIKNASKLKTPMLLLHGTNDKITDYKGSVDFASKSKMADIKLFEEAYHELHNDFGKEEVLKYIVSWINSKI